MDLDRLQRALGHHFSDAALLQLALTHRSYGQPHNERLEFLGDSVLDCVIASILFRHFGQLDEGHLSRLRSHLVRQQSLYEIARRIGLGEHMLLGEGELRSGGAQRPSMLADMLEAVLGAIYLDAGFDAAHRVVAALYEPVLRTVDPLTQGRDAKTLLQEWLQARKLPLPIYSIVAVHGAPHSQSFEVECELPTLSVKVKGSGPSRRAAEQMAAGGALEAGQAVVTRAAKHDVSSNGARAGASAAVER